MVVMTQPSSRNLLDFHGFGINGSLYLQNFVLVLPSGGRENADNSVCIITPCQLSPNWELHWRLALLVLRGPRLI